MLQDDSHHRARKRKVLYTFFTPDSREHVCGAPTPISRLWRSDLQEYSKYATSADTREWFWDSRELLLSRFERSYEVKSQLFTNSN